MTGIRPINLRPRVTFNELQDKLKARDADAFKWLSDRSEWIDNDRLETEHMQTPRNCGSCRFFHNAKRTLCKRYPPVAHGKREAFWPAVLWDDSCGEWEPRPGDGKVEWNDKA